MTTELFIRRPVMTTLLMLGIVIFGLMAYQLLPVSDLPNVDLPTVLVTATVPGASPETMASAVATPLERQFTTIAGVTSITSTSALGLTQITVQFTLDRNIDAAAQDIGAAVTQAQKLLPPQMPAPPPMKMSVNAPMNSATPRRTTSSSIAGDDTKRFGRSRGG